MGEFSERENGGLWVFLGLEMVLMVGIFLSSGDPFVSKSHCIITNGALRDTSKNGTRVNGSRVEEVEDCFCPDVLLLFCIFYFLSLFILSIYSFKISFGWGT